METLITWLDEERGRRLRLAKAIKITPGALSQWDRVPADRVLGVEAETGISRHDLRPDIYGEASTAPPQQSFMAEAS